MRSSTPETYLGLSRLDRAVNRITNIGTQSFTLQDGIPKDYFSYGGTWDIQNGTIILDIPRLYSIVDLKGKSGEHLLNLLFDSEGIEVFAFTFG